MKQINKLQSTPSPFVGRDVSGRSPHQLRRRKQKAESYGGSDTGATGATGRHRNQRNQSHGADWNFAAGRGLLTGFTGSHGGAGGLLQR